MENLKEAGTAAYDVNTAATNGASKCPFSGGVAKIKTAGGGM